MSIEKEPILPADENQEKKSSRINPIAKWFAIAIAVIVIGVLLYVFAYRQPAIQKGNDAIGEADRIALLQGNDSLALEAYEAVAANYGFYAGNRAKLECAQILYNQGEYQKALDYVNSYKCTDNVVAAQALGLKGDCLVNLDRNSEAIKAFDKAISQADKNPQLVPYFMDKKATVLVAEGKYADAVKVYKEIEKDYPAYAQRFFVEGHRVQAEAFAAKK